ncbi:hypothetical protein RclHR1_03520005 [Rhizophagus clarus]|uniref:Uncharacterized protein n=1 Tax=Rhizophagus clarus TaxID=94130 RepID=A0A2Z6RAN4_9GLOM|nr:hypothetical protein RclHR1_03520005 [Rhizophagus clarus]GET04850.1 hypothetical protein GLOIN_2v1775051 [Rhizophagus clarus]
MIPLTLVDLLQPTVFKPISEEPDVTDNTIIMNILESVGKDGQQRITNILNYIVLFYIKQNILIPGRSTLHIQISGDGRNVGQKVKHVMLTMALLNDIDGLQKPDNHYTLVLYPGAKIYESLKNALAPLISDLVILKEKGFNQINDHYWSVELYFNSDWKFLSIYLGIKSANTLHFCLWCNCSKDEINITSKKINKSIDNIKLNYNQINDYGGLMLSDLCYDTVNEEVWKEKILLEMQRLKISFQFWYERNSNNLSHTLLMSPNKLKVLRELDLTTIFQSRTQAIQIHALWDQFHDLYYLI